MKAYLAVVTYGIDGVEGYDLFDQSIFSVSCPDDLSTEVSETLDVCPLGSLIFDLDAENTNRPTVQLFVSHTGVAQITGANKAGKQQEQYRGNRCPGQTVPGTQGIPGASPGQRGGPTARCEQTRGSPGLDEQACRGHPRRIMLNPFGQPELIKAEVFTSLPAKFRARGRTAWSDPNRQGAEVDSFLEGPSFDRAGNLYVVDIPFGRVFRITPRGEWELVIQYDGWPNGSKLHKDGRLVIADYRTGLMVLDPRTGKIEPLLQTAYSEGFRGLNDLHFATTGDLYFTDQGQTGIADPTGRVFRLRASGALDRLAANVPSPNGITLNAKNTQVYVAVTRAQQIWRLPLMADGQPSKTGVAIQLSGGHAGPDGIEMDAEDGLLVCHLGVGVWRFDANCLPTHLVHADGHRLLTNLAFGGPDRKTIYITDSANGEILAAKAPVAGKVMFGLQ